jgi:hypothetical protein
MFIELLVVNIYFIMKSYNCFTAKNYGDDSYTWNGLLEDSTFVPTSAVDMIMEAFSRGMPNEP